MKKTISYLLVIAITGCMTPQQWVNKQVGEDKPQEYKDGYIDGCSTGKKAAGNPYYKFKKDLDTYLSNELYKTGWDDGFSICKSDYESIGRH